MGVARCACHKSARIIHLSAAVCLPDTQSILAPARGVVSQQRLKDAVKKQRHTVEGRLAVCPKQLLLVQAVHDPRSGGFRVHLVGGSGFTSVPQVQTRRTPGQLPFTALFSVRGFTACSRCGFTACREWSGLQPVHQASRLGVCISPAKQARGSLRCAMGWLRIALQKPAQHHARAGSPISLTPRVHGAQYVRVHRARCARGQGSETVGVFWTRRAYAPADLHRTASRF